MLFELLTNQLISFLCELIQAFTHFNFVLALCNVYLRWLCCELCPSLAHCWLGVSVVVWTPEGTLDP